jgi:hypothetical protein
LLARWSVSLPLALELDESKRAVDHPRLAGNTISFGAIHYRLTSKLPNETDLALAMFILLG